jgi:hypothetical protein
LDCGAARTPQVLLGANTVGAITSTDRRARDVFLLGQIPDRELQVFTRATVSASGPVATASFQLILRRVEQFQHGERMRCSYSIVFGLRIAGVNASAPAEARVCDIVSCPFLRIAEDAYASTIVETGFRFAVAIVGWGAGPATIPGESSQVPRLGLSAEFRNNRQ